MSKNKAIKTCGECKWFVLNSEGRCRSNEGEENASNDCCSFFEPKVITNGDKIRQMSDETLAEKFVYISLEEYYKPFSANKCGNGLVIREEWRSTITGGTWKTKPEAIAATVAELKKEYKENE